MYSLCVLEILCLAQVCKDSASKIGHSSWSFSAFDVDLPSCPTSTFPNNKVPGVPIDLSPSLILVLFAATPDGHNVACVAQYSGVDFSSFLPILCQHNNKQILQENDDQQTTHLTSAT